MHYYLINERASVEDYQGVFEEYGPKFRVLCKFLIPIRFMVVSNTVVFKSMFDGVRLFIRIGGGVKRIKCAANFARKTAVAMIRDYMTFEKALWCKTDVSVD